MKKLIIAALMALFAIPAQAATTVQLTMMVDLNYVITRSDPDPVVEYDDSWTSLITITGTWDEGFNAYDFHQVGGLCDSCMKPTFVGNTLSLLDAPDSLPCHCFELISLTFDRNISAGPSALQGAEFVSGSFRYWSGGSGLSEDLTGEIRSLWISQPNEVPEPATWAMMIGGLALVGASMRRQKVTVSIA